MCRKVFVAAMRKSDILALSGNDFGMATPRGQHVGKPAARHVQGEPLRKPYLLPITVPSGLVTWRPASLSRQGGRVTARVARSWQK
jgi:hypothetical protein